MRKILYTGLLVTGLLVLGACTTTEENEYLQSPGTLTATVVNNGYAVQLQWDVVDDADGYYVYRGNVAVDTIDDKDSTTIIVTVNDIYSVRAYKDDLLSDPTNSVDLRPVQTDNVVMYDAITYSDTAHPSGAGWDENGNLLVYPLTGHCDVVDMFYVNGLIKGIQQSTSSCPNSPDTTYFALVNARYEDLDSIPVEPTTGEVPATINAVYAVKVITSSRQVYYGKIKVVSVNTTEHSVTLSGALQLLEGYKRVGNAAK